MSHKLETHDIKGFLVLYNKVFLTHGTILSGEHMEFILFFFFLYYPLLISLFSVLKNYYGSLL